MTEMTKTISFDDDIVEGDHPSAPDRITGTISENVTTAIQNVTAMMVDKVHDNHLVASCTLVVDTDTKDSINMYGNDAGDAYLEHIVVYRKAIKVVWRDCVTDLKYWVSFPNPFKPSK